jgi:proteasome lid subunit RPN8/RPN11
MLTISASVLQRSLEQLRACGRGRSECVVYWVGPLSHADTIDEVVHPAHTATATGYDVDGPWLNELWLRLAREGLELRAQVHTHPGAAYHSSRDDAMAALQTEGFLSLVIPDFALGSDPLVGAHLVERAADGRWHDVDAVTRLSIRS